IGVDGKSAAEALGARLALLDALPGLAQVTAGSHDSTTTLDGFSTAVRPLIPHDWVNVAWLEEDGGRFHLLGAVVDEAGGCPGGPQEGDLAPDGSPLPYTLRTGEPQVIDDYQAGPGWADVAPSVRALVEREGLHAALIVALRVGGRVIGAMALASRQIGQYTEQHLAIAQHIADQLAPFVENLRLYAIERRQREHIEALNAIGQTIAASLEIDAVFPIFATAARRLVEHDRVGVALLSDDGLAFERLAFAAH